MNFEIEFDSYEDEFEDDDIFDMVDNLKIMTDENNEDLAISLKWMLDGASSMKEMIELARSFAVYLEELQKVGYNLVNVVENGNILISLKESNIDLEESIF